MEESILVSIDDLSVSFRSGKVLRPATSHVTIAIKQGSTLAIVGESGSGKSVTTLSLMGLLDSRSVVFRSGEFRFDLASFPQLTDKGQTLFPDDPSLSTLRGKGIAMIFQEPMTSLNPVMTCGEQVSEMIIRHKNISREKARIETIKLFAEVKLPRAEIIFDQYPHQLSGGQRQRVMIAMAISCDPKILIADEPTTALDVTVQQEVLSLLQALQKKHRMALVFISHDLGVVADIADEVVVMKRGEIVEYGRAASVLNSPQHAYTKGLLACRPDPSKKGNALLTVADFTAETSPAETQTTDRRDTITLDTGDTILSVSNLTKDYTSQSMFKKRAVVRAVDGVSFEIKRGETLGLVGESGCGKTTLSRMVLGLISPTSGDVIFNLNKDNPKAVNIAGLSRSEMRHLRKEVQIIFQDPYSSLNPRHTIGSAITEPMEVFGLHGSDRLRRLRSIELLQRVGLSEEHFSRYPHEFSGGQRQRIVIARALACEPSFVVCDESVSALDVSVQAQVLNLLNELKRDFNLSYLFISHDLNVVYYMSDRILVMNKGKIEEAGSCDDVFFRPQAEYTKKLLSATPGRHFG